LKRIFDETEGQKIEIIYHPLVKLHITDFDLIFSEFFKWIEKENAVENEL